jgi:hypothetical protein
MRIVSLLLVCAAVLRAQDPFEIHVYEYEPLPLGTFTYEAHLNYVAKGAKTFDGALAPTQNQFHFSSEVTSGLTDDFRLAAVLLTAKRPDQSLEYAGFRVLPHIYAPPRWNLPLNLGLVAEFSFSKAAYVDNPWQVELRPIVEKHIGRLQLDGNPVFSHALRGDHTNAAWVFEPAARIGWQVLRTFTPSVEYYSSLGPLHHFAPVDDQIHQIFAGGDWKLREHVTWSFGAGFGLTPSGSGLILKSHVQFEFGEPSPNRRR